MAVGECTHGDVGTKEGKKVQSLGIVEDTECGGLQLQVQGRM